MNRVSSKKNDKQKKYFLLGRGYSKFNRSEQVIQSLNFAFISRKTKKRNFKLSWIVRINVICRIYSLNYSFFLGALRKFNIFVDKKIASFLMYYDTASIAAIIRILKK
jgi:large subunit ribosomal protein L20